MEKVKEFLSANPHFLGILFAIVGVAGLLAAIFDWDWLFKKDVSGVTYSLKKIDGWINMFGRNTARVFVGIGSAPTRPTSGTSQDSTTRSSFRV